MTDDERKVLLGGIINTAQEAKNHLGKGTPGRQALNQIIRFAKILYVDAIKAPPEV